VKDAVEPTTTLLLDGWVVMLGGKFKVNVAELLVTDPTEFFTVTLNDVPLSVVTVVGVVYEAEVAPEIVVPFFSHWYVSVADPLATTLNVALEPSVTF
jgi:hypothetical protein